MNYRRLFIPNAIIFITFVTFERKEILISNIDLLHNAFAQTKQKYKFDIYAIYVMKNHVHMLIKPNNINDYPIIVKNIKREFSVNIDTKSLHDYYESEKPKIQK